MNAGLFETLRKFRARVRWKRWLLIATILGCAYGVWREHDFRSAIKEAQAVGLSWRFDDPWEAIHQDWRAAFKISTWRDGHRDLCLDADQFRAHPKLIRRLRPRGLIVAGEIDSTDLSLLTNLPELRALNLAGCNNLTDLSALKNLSALRRLVLEGCTALGNVDELKEFSELEQLDLNDCAELTNLDVLKGLPELKEISLGGCTQLTNLEPLKRLQKLNFVDLVGCTGLSADSIKELRKALPKAQILTLE